MKEEKKDYYECSVKGCSKLANRKIIYKNEEIYLCSHHNLNDYIEGKRGNKLNY